MSAHHSPVVLVKTSAGPGLSETTAVASPEAVRSKVSTPDVVICPDGVTICPDGVTVTEIRQKAVNINPFTVCHGGVFSFRGDMLCYVC